jgi:hypothetical protein
VAIFNSTNERLIDDLISVTAHTNVCASVGKNTDSSHISPTGSQNHRRLMSDSEVCVSTKTAQRREQTIIVLRHDGAFDASGSRTLQMTLLANTDRIIVKQPGNNCLETCA